jgi:hypothetical protein
MIRHDIEPDWNDSAKNGGFGGQPAPVAEPEDETTPTEKETDARKPKS